MSSCILFGGTFDPPHLGHKMVVDSIEKLSLGELIIIPNKKPYYKDEIKTSDSDRLYMIKLMFNNYEIDTFEIEHNRYTPTYETIMRYKEKYDIVYFVLGSDSYSTIKTWHNYEYLMQNCNFIIVNRGDTFDLQKQSDIVLDNEILNISSTEIRRNIDGKFLTKEVRDYIIQRSLYATKNS